MLCSILQFHIRNNVHVTLTHKNVLLFPRKMFYIYHLHYNFIQYDYIGTNTRNLCFVIYLN